MDRDDGKLSRTSITPAPELIGTAPGSRSLIVQAGEGLFALEEAALAAARAERVVIDLRDHPRSRRLAAGVSGAWSINPVTRTMAFVDEERITTAGLDDQARPRRSAAPGLGGTIEGIVQDDGDTGLVWLSRDKGDPEFDQRELCCIDLRSGKIIADGILSVVGRVHAVWSASARSFFVLDFDGERLWRIGTGGLKAEVPFPDRGGERSPSQLTVHPRGSPLAILLEDAATDAWRLLQGIADDKAVRWEGSIDREGEICECIRWHPQLRRFACERRIGRHSMLAVFDARGTLVCEQPLPDEWVVTDLIWSGDGKCIHVAFDRGIASAEMDDSGRFSR